MQGLATEPFALGGQAPALVVIKAWLVAQQLLQDSNLLLQIFDDILLVAAQFQSSGYNRRTEFTVSAAGRTGLECGGRGLGKK
jgi:hypothetical protein